MAQIKLAQLGEDIISVINGRGVFDVDEHYPLSSGFYTIGSAITASYAANPKPTFIKFSITATIKEVWYYNLKVITNTDYINASNWAKVSVLNPTGGIDGNDVSIQMRRNLETVLNASIIPPLAGEIVVALNSLGDVIGVKVGNGTTLFQYLPYINVEKVIAWSSTPSDSRFPTEKLVADSFDRLKFDGGNW
jgi:hypothetical protein